MVLLFFKQTYSRDTAPRKLWYELVLDTLEDRLFVILDFKNTSFGTDPEGSTPGVLMASAMFYLCWHAHG